MIIIHSHTKNLGFGIYTYPILKPKIVFDTQKLCVLSMGIIPIPITQYTIFLGIIPVLIQKTNTQIFVYWVWLSYQYPNIIPNTQFSGYHTHTQYLIHIFFWVSNTILSLGIGYGYIPKPIFFVCECMMIINEIYLQNLIF